MEVPNKNEKLRLKMKVIKKGITAFLKLKNDSE